MFNSNFEMFNSRLFLYSYSLLLHFNNENICKVLEESTTNCLKQWLLFSLFMCVACNHNICYLQWIQVSSNAICVILCNLKLHNSTKYKLFVNIILQIKYDRLVIYKNNF